MNRIARLASFVIAGVMLSGCPETAQCAEGEVRLNGACVPLDGTDGGTVDAGPPDAGRDAGPCGECDATAPYCVLDDTGEYACRECDPGIGNDSCTSPDRPVCDGATARCVECTTNTDCSSPEASRCADNRCVPCGGNDDCAHVTDSGVALDICVMDGRTARCGECTIGTEVDDCGTAVCDPDTLRCAAGTMRGSRTNCQTCVSDSHCASEHSCVPLQFEGADHGSYCLRNWGLGACARPFTVQLVGRTTRSGATGDFCGIQESLTTCEAVLAFARSCTEDTDCAPAGGLCGASVGGTSNVCTYRCEDALQCPGSRDCPTASGYCGGPS